MVPKGMKLHELMLIIKQNFVLDKGIISPQERKGTDGQGKEHGAERVGEIL
jgi:hypothetical protein